MTTIILNHQPYDGSDVTWNALRLAKTLHKSGEAVNIFWMILPVISSKSPKATITIWSI